MPAAEIIHDAQYVIEDKTQFFAHLRRELNPGPTLRDARTWDSMNRTERACLLAIAGYSKYANTYGGHGRSDIERFRQCDWFDLPGTARSRIKQAARRMRGLLGLFEGCRA